MFFFECKMFKGIWLQQSKFKSPRHLLIYLLLKLHSQTDKISLVGACHLPKFRSRRPKATVKMTLYEPLIMGSNTISTWCITAFVWTISHYFNLPARTQTWCEFIGQAGCHLMVTRLESQSSSAAAPDDAILFSHTGLVPVFQLGLTRWWFMETQPNWTSLVSTLCSSPAL